MGTHKPLASDAPPANFDLQGDPLQAMVRIEPTEEKQCATWACSGDCHRRQRSRHAT